MTQRGLPPIDPSDLRDHATPERIERVWARVAADLGSSPATVTYPHGRYLVAALAAALAAFAGGVVIGKNVWNPPAASVPAVSSPDLRAPAEASEVFAAGSRGRIFNLPGGGSITLSPGATVELLERSGNSIRLRLVQGEASVNTAGAAPAQLFDIEAEDTVLSTRTGGVLRINRRADDIDVSVSDGQVDVRAPTGTHSLSAGERADEVPIRSRPTALAPPHVRPRASAVRVYAEAAPRVEPAPAPVALPDWRAKSNAGEMSEALRLLQSQPGGVEGAIASATSGAELMELNDVLSRSDPPAAVRALTRIVDSFPNDAYAQIAAYKLGSMYQRMGRADQASAYFERAERLQGALAEDAFCQRIRTAPGKDEALRAATDYLAKYPEGSCRAEAERAVAGEAPAAEDDPAPPEAPSPDAGSP